MKAEPIQLIPRKLAADLKLSTVYFNQFSYCVGLADVDARLQISHCPPHSAHPEITSHKLC